MREEIYDNWRNDEKKTLIFVYYAGHGVMTNMTHVVCNGGVDKQGRPSISKARYPLENSIRSLGVERGAYVISIFDCCREQLSEAMRGGMPNDPNDNIDMSMDDYHNFILWFGCPAGSQVDARSTIAVDFFQELRRNAKRSDGTILLPAGLMTS